MVTMNLLYFHLKDELGEVIYNTQRPSFYEDILHKKTLLYWSTMFPKIVKGIQITQNDAIPIKHPQTGITCLSGMYKIPKFNPNDEYINYEQVRYNGNLVMNQASSSLPAMNGMLNQVSSMLPNSQYFGVVRYSFDFMAPDILTIDPIPMKHLDFSLDKIADFLQLYENVSRENIYIQSVKVNGQPYDKSYITHQQIMDGATVEFVMGNQPGEIWY